MPDQLTLRTERPKVVRMVRRGDTVAHLFSSGPGWTRSLCRDVMWTAALQTPADGLATCPGCLELEPKLGAQL